MNEQKHDIQSKYNQLLEKYKLAVEDVNNPSAKDRGAFGEI